jgi:hypothetical protein
VLQFNVYNQAFEPGQISEALQLGKLRFGIYSKLSDYITIDNTSEIHIHIATCNKFLYQKFNSVSKLYVT